eukprot:2139157-Prymnesium_polylepis.1
MLTNYEESRRGEHHDRTRGPGESYGELSAENVKIRAANEALARERDELHTQLKLEAAETRELSAKLQACIEGEQLELKETSVAEILQQAVITLIDQKN